MVQDLIVCLQEATVYFILKKSWVPKHPDECFVNPPCGCLNPGKEIKCEDCPHLEACFSNWKLHNDHVKPRAKCVNKHLAHSGQKGHSAVSPYSIKHRV